MSHLDPYSLLNEMFHTDYFQSERDWDCPVCKSSAFGSHDELINHMRNNHKKYMKKYIRDIDMMLYDPYQYFSVRWADNQCRLCGDTFSSEGEFNRHMKFHSREIEEFKEEMGGD